MQTKRRVLVGCLSTFLVIAGALAFVYACIVLTPTGYKDFERAQAADLERTHEAVKPRTESRPTTPTAVVATAAPYPIPNETDPFGNPIGFMNTLSKLGEFLVPVSPVDQSEVSQVSEMMWNVGRFWSIGVRGMSDEEVLAKALKESTSQPERWRKTDPTGKIAHPAQVGALLGAKLDEIEKFLANVPYDRFPDFDTFTLAGYDHTFSNYAVVAMIRACERREWEKATRIAESFLELKHRIHMAAFTQPWVLFGYETTTFPFGDYPDFPDDKLARIAARLDRMRLTPADLARFRKADAIRAGKQYKKQRGEMNTAVGNTWHFFAGGAPERVTTTMISPILDRQVESLVMAWANGKPDEIKRCEDQVETTRRLMNLRFSPLCLYYEPQLLSYRSDQAGFKLYQPSDEDRRRMNGDLFNYTIDLNRLAFAAMRYRNATGHYPNSIGELGTKYYKPIADSAIGLEWKILRVPATAAQDGATSATETFAIWNKSKIRDGVELQGPIDPAIPALLRELVR
ncbi:MAG: hypothetical protein ABFD69_09425 [Candidatus Sumerlaeia bacterium]